MEDISGYIQYMEENEIPKNPWGFKEIWFILGRSREAIRIA
jgi:hypothetical protein